MSNKQSFLRALLGLLCLIGFLGAPGYLLAQQSATTLTATGLTATGATLNGSANVVPNNSGVAVVYFQYDLTQSLGLTTPSQSAGSGFRPFTVAFSNSIGGLVPGTLYYFRAVLRQPSQFGLTYSYGSTLSLTSVTGSPTATTLTSTNVSAGSAILSGSLTTGGLITKAFFRYGLTTNYGSFSTTNILAATNVFLTVSNQVGGLTAGGVYHFQLVVQNSAGTAYGVDQTFTASTQSTGFKLSGSNQLAPRSFVVSFTNTNNLSFTVLATTNVLLPSSNWNVLGSPIESPAGHYTFTDTQVSNMARRFYQVRQP